MAVHSYASTMSFSKEKGFNRQPSRFSGGVTKLMFCVAVFSLWALLLLRCYPPAASSSAAADEQCDPDIAPFYIYPLPDRFNAKLLQSCRSLSQYTDMCPHVAHRGLGRPIADIPSFHATHQFLAEMIFHARALRHPCRVRRPDAAALFYVPFYGGLSVSSLFSEPNITLRDAPSADLITHLSHHPAFRRRNGSDHFLAIGRTAWDFMRSAAAAADFGANRLMLLPETSNMTFLTVERQPWEGKNQRGIPYPSYFHPKTLAEMQAWQEAVRAANRTHLFAFIGGPRVGLEKAAVRAEILSQCGASGRCLTVQCEPGSKSCHEPGNVVAVMKRSVFCMQPPGDSFTRRSVFDSILAGCVPVFFNEHTAYTQYRWYLPARPEEWSVFIGPDRWGRIEEELDRVPAAAVAAMRERVVEMIPRVTYAHPDASWRGLGFRDAVDVALVELSRLVGPASE